MNPRPYNPHLGAAKAVTQAIHFDLDNGMEEFHATGSNWCDWLPRYVSVAIGPVGRVAMRARNDDDYSYVTMKWCRPGDRLRKTMQEGFA